MSLTDERKQELLARVIAADAGIDAAKDERARAVLDAMRAGVPRAEIAEALGTSRQRLYQIVARLTQE